jgi:hypothetical protein
VVRHSSEVGGGGDGNDDSGGDGGNNIQPRVCQNQTNPVSLHQSGLLQHSNDFSLHLADIKVQIETGANVVTESLTITAQLGLDGSRFSECTQMPSLQFLMVLQLSFMLSKRIFCESI